MRRAVLLSIVLAACSSCSSDHTTGVSDAPVGAVDAPVAPPDTEACGVRADHRGLTHRTITAGGLTRTYLVYLPAGSSPTAAMPLLFVMHGFTMSGQSMFDVTEASKLADAEHVAVAFPDGQGGPNTTGAPWNVGADVCPSYGVQPPNATGDDFAFLDAMKADISQDQCLDRDHVFMTGFSMGGYFAHHANCMRPDIRAAAPASGGTHDLASCGAGPKPIIIFHGAADPLIPPGCDDPNAIPVAGVTPSAKAWAIHNGCSATTTVSTSVQGGTCEAFVGCPANGQVTVCSFTAMGHCWAGGPVTAGVYACPGYAPATELAWQFFKQHAW
ncbi:MAG: hypothetical protein NT062_07485 [Proteobacteria bacterium]|nr:hypothetical protein [Pseudomonadota bacterium]